MDNRFEIDSAKTGSDRFSESEEPINLTGERPSDFGKPMHLSMNSSMRSSGGTKM